MQIQNIWLDTFARGVKTKFSGRELGMGCIATSHTSWVHTVFTQWRKELQKNTLQRCVLMKTSWGVYDTDIYSMLADTKQPPPNIHRCFMLDVRTWWRWLNGKRKTFLKLEIAELTNVYKQVYCTLKYAWRKKWTRLHWLDEMVWKLMHLQAKP